MLIFYFISLQNVLFVYKIIVQNKHSHVEHSVFISSPLLLNLTLPLLNLLALVLYCSTGLSLFSLGSTKLSFHVLVIWIRMDWSWSFRHETDSYALWHSTNSWSPWSDYSLDTLNCSYLLSLIGWLLTPWHSQWLCYRWPSWNA